MSDTNQTTKNQAPVFGLTKTMHDCLCVVQELSVGQVAPSLREIAHELGLASASQVQKLLVALRSRGYIAWRPAYSRSIVVLRPIPLPEDFEFVVFLNAGPEVRRT